MAKVYYKWAVEEGLHGFYRYNIYRCFRSGCGFEEGVIASRVGGFDSNKDAEESAKACVRVLNGYRRLWK